MPPPNASLLQVFPPRLNLLIIRSLPIFSLARVPKIPFRCSSSSISPNPPHQSNSSSSSSSSTSTSTPETQDKKKEVGRSGALSASPPAAGPGENQTTAIIDVNPPRGTRDFPPDDMRLRTWLFHNFREVARLFAFEEVDFPVLESEALFIRKAGEEITEQLSIRFQEDTGCTWRSLSLTKEGRPMPKMTPSTGLPLDYGSRAT